MRGFDDTKTGMFWGAAQWRGLCQAAFYGVVCLLAVIPAALAHGDDEPPSPEQMGWGLLCFIITLALVLRWCLHPPKSALDRFQSPRLPRRRLRPVVPRRVKGKK